MKKCVKCGKSVNDNDNFCANCGGQEFEQVEGFTPNYEQNAQQNVGRNQGEYYNPYVNSVTNQDIPNPVNDERKNIDDAKACGIVSILIVLIGLGGLSWIPALIGKNKLKSIVNMRESSEFSTAKLLNNIGMGIAFASIALCVIFIFVTIVVTITGVGLGFGLFNGILDGTLNGFLASSIL